MRVPFYRPELGEAEIDEVVSVLRSGWLTTGARVQRFEKEFAAAVRGPYAVAMNSCTAALHLAVDALGLRPGDGVLLPTMTFAATAEIVRYGGGIPVLVDCDPDTFNMDLRHAEEPLAKLGSGQRIAGLPSPLTIKGMIPVHVAGFMMNIDEVKAFAGRHGLWVVEDAAHAFPSAWRRDAADEWEYCGQQTAAVSCFSFYANKTITTGEGGMAVTSDPQLADEMRLMSLHGLSHQAWTRYSNGGAKSSWDYRIVAPGYKYNLTDIAAAIGIHQLARAEAMRTVRETIALEYRERLGGLQDVLDLPVVDANRIHSWHLFPIRLCLERFEVDRDTFMAELAQEGVATSVHWRPLHLHPYYEQSFGWRPVDLPTASGLWRRIVSLPLFSSMQRAEIDHVVDTVTRVCGKFARSHATAAR